MMEKKKKLPVTKEQMQFLKSLGVEDREYSRDEFYEIVRGPIDDCLMSKGWAVYDPDYITNEIGDLCEDIITALTEAALEENW